MRTNRSIDLGIDRWTRGRIRFSRTIYARVVSGVNRKSCGRPEPSSLNWAFPRLDSSRNGVLLRKIFWPALQLDYPDKFDDGVAFQGTDLEVEVHSFGVKDDIVEEPSLGADSAMAPATHDSLGFALIA